MEIREYLRENVLVMDGAMGTYYDIKCSQKGQIAEEGNLENPELVYQIHKEYIQSGANLIRTNTFALNRSFALSRGFQNEEEEREFVKNTIHTACEIAKKAAKDSGKEVYVAADIGPIAEYIFQENETTEKEEYQILIDAFLECDMDIFDFETFSDYAILEWACEYIKERKEDAFIMASFAVARNRYTSKGISLKRLFAEVSQIEKLDAYGCNCLIGASHMYEILKNQSFTNEKYMMALPNSGYTHTLRGRSLYSDSATYYAEKMYEIANLGMNILGGCCGTTPSHIKELTKKVSGIRPVERKVEAEKTEEIVVDKVTNNAFMEKLQAGETVIAVELDPPFDQNAEKVLEGAYQLKKQGVDIITLADSPLARTRADSVLLATKVSSMVDIPVMPHLACRDRNRISMHSTILGAHINGIRNLLVVTGDPVPRGERDTTKAVFDFNSITFMNYLKEVNQEIFQKDAIAYGGALNQNQANLDKLMQRMQKKIDAGVSYFLTQPIYSKEDIERMRIMKETLDTKIICGIMPLVSYRNAMFIKNELPGIFVPDEVVEQYDPNMTKAEAEAVARKISLDVIKQLDGIADGYYFMTPFNRVSLICDIIDEMKH